MTTRENPGQCVQQRLKTLRATRLYRPGTNSPDFSFTTGRWAKAIDDLLAAKYAFLPCRYTDDGYLFRGMQRGAEQSIAGGRFGHFDGDDELSRVERAMDVYFLTHEISDAVTVSRFFENPRDACIIAVRAKLFNGGLDEYRAAVLGVGDGGIVFRYPFLTTPIAGAQLGHVFVGREFNYESEVAKTVAGKIVSVAGNSRKELETILAQQCRQLGIRPATPVPSALFPRPV